MSATPPQPPLTDPFRIGDVEIANRVLLAPLAGIGNWFVRLQAKRHGAGLAVSEMVSSFGLHHRNERTLRELMRIHPDEHPVSVQLFGHDAEVMRSGRGDRRRGRRRPDRHQHGLPGAQGAQDRRRRRAAARPRAGPRPGPRRRRGQRPAGDGEAALGDRGGRPLRLRAGRAPGRGGRRRRDRLPPARRHGRPQGRARLRAHPRAGRAGRGAGDRLRRPEERRGGAPRLRGVRRRRGDDRPRLARQPLGLRGADRPPQRAARARRGRRRAALGDRPRRGASRAASGPAATCASSTPGTWSRSAHRPSSPTSCSAAPTCPAPAA